MREIDRLAKDAAWSTTELARRLGVDPTMLMHIRAGRNQFSASLLGKIAQVFPTPTMDALIVHHLRVERAARSATTLAVPDDAALDLFDAETRRALRAFVHHFARASVETGRGLYLRDPDVARLSRAAQFLTKALHEQGIVVERLMSNATITASVGHAAMAAALLVVERVEFRTPAMTDLLVRRSDVVKPIVVTSTEDRATIIDPYLARIVASQLRDLPLTRAVTSSPHADAR